MNKHFTEDTIKEVARLLDPVYSLFKKYYFRIGSERKLVKYTIKIYFTLWEYINENWRQPLKCNKKIHKYLKKWFKIEKEVMHLFWKLEFLEIRAEFVFGRRRRRTALI
ncbi:E4 ORF3 [Bat mastadenovirus WIV13]|uniref:E4 ORF3 n=1 Tax=Bat mastadenovirus WIV13 TaxID=1788435 RepID=A0A1B0UHY2_9ADEN|nr:E4 ORF3 [Bat mastadenovirus WIV13]AMB43042.1 E4 ORF3 [Bat mastadenovirus WIV13]